MDGGDSSDTLNGSADSDALAGGEGDDTLDGAEGAPYNIRESGGGDGEFNPLEAITEAAGAAFAEALANGANPEDAFTASAAAATQAADDLEIPSEISDPLFEAAQTAFEAAIADGATPGEAFETAGDGVADLGAQFFEGGEGDDTFIQDFSSPGENTNEDFNFLSDKVDFKGLDELEEISVNEVDGNTVIDAGPGNTLTINFVTPEALAGNVLIKGEPVPGNSEFNLQSSLQNAVDVGITSSLGAALDATLEQGAALFSSDVNRNDVPDDQALLDDPNQDQDEDQNEADQSFEVDFIP